MINRGASQGRAARSWILAVPLVVGCGKPPAAPEVELPSGKSTHEASVEQAARRAPGTCATGNAEACADEGLRLSKAGDDAGAVALYRRACEGNSARGCDFLGGRLRDGRGVTRDLRAAVAAFERSCDRGALTACQSLGSMYANGGAGDGTETGSGLPIDLARSFQFHQRACDGGLGEGCLSVAYMYEHGEHVAADVAKAFELYRKACEAGSGDGCFGLSQLYSAGRGVAKNESKATALLEQGCQLGGAFACAELAERFHQSGKNECCTHALVLRACKRGHRQACMFANAMWHDWTNAVAQLQQACQSASFAACEFVKGDGY